MPRAPWSSLRKNSFPCKLNTFCCLQIRKWNNSVSRLPSNTQCQHCMKRKIFICKCSNKDFVKDLSIWISLQTTFNLSVKSADVYFGRESIRETYFSERKVLRSQKKRKAKMKKVNSFSKTNILRIFLQCKGWTTPTNPHNKLI